MKAVLLAAGEGTRLHPLTLTTPKCLVPINGKPLIDYWLEMLVPCDEIDEIFINVSYLKEQVIDHISNKWQGCNKIFLWQENKLLGTAGTLKANYSQLKDDDIMVIHADNLSAFDLRQFINAHKTRLISCKITMMLFKTDCPSQCGIVELDNTGLVIDMHEKVKKPPGNLANGAVYIFEKSVIDLIYHNNSYDISLDVIPNFLGHICSWLNSNYHRDIGSPESYSLAQKELLLK